MITAKRPPKPERLRVIDEDIDRVIQQYRKTRSDEDFKRVIRSVRPSMFKLARKHGRKYNHNFEDAFQAALLWLHENIDRLDESKLPATIQMYRIFDNSYRRNNCLPAHRSVKTRMTFLSFLAFDDGSGVLHDIEDTRCHHPDDEPPGDNWEEKVAALREAMEELPPRMKSVVHGMFFMNDMSMPKLAEILGIGSPQICRDLHSALGRLERNNKLRVLFGLPPVAVIKKEKAHVKGELTEYQREVVRLIHVEKLSRTQVGRRLGISSGSIRDAWLGALKKIAKSPKLQEQTGIRPGMYGI